MYLIVHTLQIYQKLLDDVTPYVMGRWLFAALLTVAFLARVFLLQVYVLSSKPRCRYADVNAHILWNINRFMQSEGKKKVSVVSVV